MKYVKLQIEMASAVSTVEQYSRTLYEVYPLLTVWSTVFSIPVPAANPVSGKAITDTAIEIADITKVITSLKYQSKCLINEQISI